MPPRPIILIAAAAVALVCIGGLFAWDATNSDRIGNGVAVGGIDVSGLQAGEARARLEERLLKPLAKPLIVKAADKEFALSAKEARIQAHVDKMVDAAVQRSREGGILARAWRSVSGADLNARIAPDVAFSVPAVRRLVDRVRVEVSRKPQDATVDFGADNVEIRPARTGLTIDATRLRANVERALVTPLGDRSLRVHIDRVKPRVSGAKLAKEYPVLLTVDRGGYRINLFKNLKRVKTYPIAVGQAGLETPAGLYKIQNKAINPAWSVPNSPWAGSLAGQVIPGGTPQNPLKARWLGVYDGVGVHGTDARGSIGTNASHGCIRMLIEDVEVLYDEVPVGTPIYIG